MKKIAVFLVCILLLCTLFSSCAKSGSVSAVSGNFAMGSYVAVTVYGEAKEAEIESKKAIDAVKSLDALLSATDNESEVGRLNRGEEVRVSDPTLAVIEKSMEIERASSGALNVFLGALTEQWGFSSDLPRLPSEAEILQALQTVKQENIQLNGNLLRLKNGVRLDLGAVGKGAALDEAAAVLKNNSTAAMINFGGSVLFYGKHPEKESWTLGIRDPFGGPEDYFATLSFTPGADADTFIISTSGSYEKSFTENGKTYHHILDPATGFPVENDLVSVTAVSDSGLVSDALSTALFVMGYNEASLSLAEKYLFGAVFVFRDGRVIVTRALKETARFRIQNENFVLTDAI